MSKGTLIYISILLALMISLPSTALLFREKIKTEYSPIKEGGDVMFKVYLPETKEVKEYSAKEYLFGVVSGEMNITYEEEALKAQTIAAYTLALHRKNKRSQTPDNTIKNADVSADSKIDQAFLTREQIKEKWGENYPQYAEKLEGIIFSVLGKCLTYNGEIAQTVYHDTSGGKTESAQNIWGSKIDYLQSVQSVGDLMNPNYLTKVSITTDEFISVLAKNKIKISSQELKTKVKISSRSESGTVLLVDVGSNSLKGTKTREIFNLRSANFDISFTNDKVEFTVRGYGHGVGMSQYGANEMAKQGSGYEDILKWYYKGCEITDKPL